ncbi:MAG TPA: mandelate racemase/muconate lactonizing enzyme family protein [Gammaproteobacteria bacterium]|nr:mandelate racemase/muconate lactonizing enzyme family protein [Gammaproteobacteria bacterium]
MKIAALETIKLKIPLNKPMRTRHINLEQAFCLLLILKTDEGLEGQGLIRTVSLSDVQLVENFIKIFFAPNLLEKEFTTPEKLWLSLWLNKRNHLQSSYGLYALAAIDIALWDLLGKAAQKPLHQLLNIEEKHIPVYGNGGWLIDTNKEMVTDIVWYLDRGCKYFKMRIGSDNDLTRIQFLRQTFGSELELIVDANQFYDFASAVEMSKILAEYDVLWFEEPLYSASITELSHLAELSSIPIATGENMNSHWQIKDACELKAAQILQPDVIYQGGITEFVRSAEIINDYGLKLGAHLFHELSLSLAGLANQHYVEHIDFFPDDFFNNDFTITNGKIVLPETPGHGVTISDRSIQKYQFF